MNKSTSKMMIGATAAASLAAGLAVFFVLIAPEAKAESAIAMSVHQPSGKGDRLPVLVSMGAACSVHAWPDYDRTCQFDARTSSSVARTVRIIAVR